MLVPRTAVLGHYVRRHSLRSLVAGAGFGHNSWFAVAHLGRDPGSAILRTRKISLRPASPDARKAVSLLPHAIEQHKNPQRRVFMYACCGGGIRTRVSRL